MHEIISDGSSGPRTWAPFIIELDVKDEMRLKTLFNEIQAKNAIFENKESPSLPPFILQFPVFLLGMEAHRLKASVDLQTAKQVADLMQAGFTPKPVTVNFECGPCG
jgi:hypothetical protein